MKQEIDNEQICSSFNRLLRLKQEMSVIRVYVENVGGTKNEDIR